VAYGASVICGLRDVTLSNLWPMGCECNLWLMGYDKCNS